MTEHERSSFEEYVAVAAYSVPKSDGRPLHCPVCGSEKTIINHPDKLTFEHTVFCPARLLNHEEDK